MRLVAVVYKDVWFDNRHISSSNDSSVDSSVMETNCWILCNKVKFYSPILLLLFYSTITLTQLFQRFLQLLLYRCYTSVCSSGFISTKWCADEWKLFKTVFPTSFIFLVHTFPLVFNATGYLGTEFCFILCCVPFAFLLCQQHFLHISILLHVQITVLFHQKHP